MFKYYIKSVIRSLEANKKSTAINIIGFAFAVSVCIVISLYIVHEQSYDRYHTNADRIVRLIDSKNNSSNIDYRVKDILLSNFPEFENACLVQRETSPMNINVGKKALYLDNVMSVDNDFFKLFSIPFIVGDQFQAFTDINSVVITEKTAKLLFGNIDPIGKEILVGRTNLLSVTGVIEDFPDNSSITAGLLVNSDNDDFKFSFSCESFKDKSTHRWEFRIYGLLNKESNQNQVVQKINSSIKVLSPYVNQIAFLPLKNIYLEDDTIGSRTKKGNPQLINLLASIAIIILILAVVNYVNLSLAQQKKKNKITGVRKSFGASKSNLFTYYIVESIIVSCVSFLFSVIMIWFFVPFYSLIFDSPINVNLFFNLYYLIAILLSMLAIGCLSGLGPAIILSKALPYEVLNNLSKSSKQFYFRNSLIIFQFTVSIILIVSLLVVQKQISFVKHQDPGFSEKNMICLSIPYLPKKEKPKATTLLNDLKTYPFFENISLTNGVPGKINFTMGSGIEGSEKNVPIPCLIVDTSFMSTFNFQLIKGRGLQAGDFGKVCMINEAFYKHFEFNDLKNKRFKNYKDGGFKIIGVVKDFQYSSLHNRIEPLCILFAENSNNYQLSMRISLNSITPAMRAIKESWQTILPEYPLQYQFYDDWFDKMYQKEERFSKTIGLFALLAIAISCFGILGLVMFTSEQRTKEIGIRKSNGAKSFDIIKMLNIDFLKKLALSFLFACPIAYYAMDKWLENFAYKTELSWWIFVLAGFIAMGIALLTISFQSWRAATRNPVESLRYE